MRDGTSAPRGADGTFGDEDYRPMPEGGDTCEDAMTLNLKMPDIRELKPRITVFGVGGAGGNAVNNMIQAGLKGVDFVVVRELIGAHRGRVRALPSERGAHFRVELPHA